MSTKPLVRPSVAHSLALAKLEREPPSRLVIQVSRDVPIEIRTRATEKGVSMTVYILELLAADGVQSARAELDGKSRRR